MKVRVWSPSLRQNDETVHEVDTTDPDEAILEAWLVEFLGIGLDDPDPDEIDEFLADLPEGTTYLDDVEVKDWQERVRKYWAEE